MRARRCSSSACRGELPGALRSSTCQCYLVSVTGLQHTSRMFSHHCSCRQYCIQLHNCEPLLLALALMQELPARWLLVRCWRTMCLSSC